MSHISFSMNLAMIWKVEKYSNTEPSKTRINNTSAIKADVQKKRSRKMSLYLSSGRLEEKRSKSASPLCCSCDYRSHCNTRARQFQSRLAWPCFSELRLAWPRWNTAHFISLTFHFVLSLLLQRPFMSCKCVVFKSNPHSFQLAGQFEIINKETWMNEESKAECDWY